MSEKKKSYVWLVILLLVVIVLFVIISKQGVERQKKEAIETQVLKIDKNKKSEGEVTKKSLENLMNQLKTNLEVPTE
ncbi:hypothetical protein J7L24_01580 [bacterium]|nr:hypothetical protein [bacterium]